MNNIKLELRKIKKLQQLFSDLEKAEQWKDSYVNYEDSNITLAKLLTDILSCVNIFEFPISRKNEILNIDDNIINLVWKHKPNATNDWLKKFPNKLKSLPSLYNRVALLTTTIEKEYNECYSEKNGELCNLEDVYPLLHKFFLEFGDEYIQIKSANLLNYKLEI